MDLDNILGHELMSVPISIAEANGSLRSGNKSILVDVLTKDVKCPADLELPEDESTCLIIDGQATVVSFGKPREAKTFGDYADRFANHILAIAKKFDQTDFAFDQCRDTCTSIKDGTRERQKKTSRPIRHLIENREIPLPSKWTDFLNS